MQKHTRNHEHKEMTSSLHKFLMSLLWSHNYCHISLQKITVTFTKIKNDAKMSLIVNFYNFFDCTMYNSRVIFLNCTFIIIRLRQLFISYIILYLIRVKWLKKTNNVDGRSIYGYKLRIKMYRNAIMNF